MAKGFVSRLTDDGVEVRGTVLHALLRNYSNKYSITDVVVFSDRKISCGELFDFDDFKRRIEKGEIVTQLPPGSRLDVHGLLTCDAQNINGTIFEEDFLRQIIDEIRLLNSEKTTSEVCKEKFYTWVDDPSEKNRAELRTAYEMVPQHLRRYILGSMDEKDNPIKSAVYGDAHQQRGVLEDIRARQDLDLRARLAHLDGF